MPVVVMFFFPASRGRGFHLGIVQRERSLRARRLRLGKSARRCCSFEPLTIHAWTPLIAQTFDSLTTTVTDIRTVTCGVFGESHSRHAGRISHSLRSLANEHSRLATFLLRERGLGRDGHRSRRASTCHSHQSRSRAST
ncbi:hypothetical protein IE81DRAFT_94324 [Ceraceosorus guamensis]|uniref:Uncharacterized protein n=1 Tax=Ceraceosorus guamensis TaxID=1522189 RepID=A0A316W3U4_9BASI|nr:hypothetical protein IE81DRAFT_94324 [Ceraceosorus guamensis]PWN43291.1 hypothetical protein IE81DRAFT_94324 [Ceraceosorus guamensis]